MTDPTCPYEHDVLDLVTMDGWPDRADATLRAHVAAGETCADLAAVATSLTGWQETALAAVRVPDDAHVWRQAERRARTEAVRRASQPVLAVELAAVAAVVLLLVAWGPSVLALAGVPPWRDGWTGGWQVLAGWSAAIGSWWGRLGWPASLTSTDQWGLLPLAAWAVLVPLAFSLAGLADRRPRHRDRPSGPIG
jgi:hypothetical protein